MSNCVRQAIRLLASSRNTTKLRYFSISSSKRTCAPAGEEMDELIKNPYYAKYANKITNLQSESKEEFEKRLEDVQNLHKKPANPNNSNVRVEQPAKPDIQQSMDLSATRIKKLQDVMKLELIEDKSAQDISEIWKEYHKKENHVSATIEKEKFEKIFEKAKKYNTFLFPLPRDNGYEFVVCQFENNECHFTTLLNYQTYKENAPECLTLIHFADLAETKGIVLMKGEYHDEVIDGIEAQCLVNQLQLYYGTDDPKKTELLKQFTDNPDEFKHTDLIAELQNSIVM